MKKPLAMLFLAIGIAIDARADWKEIFQSKPVINTEEVLKRGNLDDYKNRTLPSRAYKHYLRHRDKLKWIAEDTRFNRGMRYGAFEVRVHPALQEKALFLKPVIESHLQRTIKPGSRQKLVLTVTQYSDVYRNGKNEKNIFFPFFIYEIVVFDPIVKSGEEKQSWMEEEAVFDGHVVSAMALDLVEARDPKEAGWDELFGAKWVDVLEELFETSYSVAAKDH